MNGFRLEILTPEREFYSGECVSLVIQLEDGMLGIMAGHTPMTAAIPDGEISFSKPDGEKVICAVTGGMINVSREYVRLLCGTALLPEEIDADAERRAIEEAKMRLGREQSKREYLMTRLAIAKSINMLRVKTRAEDQGKNL